MPSVTRRRALTALAVGVVAPGVLAACGSRVGKPSAEAPAAPSAPSIKYQPANAATDVAPVAPVRIEVKDGWFQRVALTNSDGKVVAGALNRDRTSFTTTEPLGYGVSYTWAGSVVGHDGKAVPVQGNFTTDQPDHSGQRPVPARRRSGRRRRRAGHHAVRRSDRRRGSGHRREGTEGHHHAASRGQLGVAARRGRRLAGALAHSKEYYPAGTKVARRREAVRRRRSATARSARRTSTLDFEIGRRQVVKAEASSHRIQVITDEGT